MSPREHAHELIERLPDAQLSALVGLLETIVPPDDDEDTLNAAERAAIAQADQWLQHNKPIPHEEVLAEFGLTMTDWERMGQEPLPGETPQDNG